MMRAGLSGAAMFLVLFVLPLAASCDEAFPFDPRKGGLEAEGPGKKKNKIPVARRNDAEQARKRKLCSSLFPPPNKERDKRSKYKPWIKELICDYMTADFTARETRDGYVKRVLAALRNNGAGAWALTNGAPVVHIVTEEPAYRYQKDKDASPRIIMVKSQSVRRSLRNPDASAIGIVDKFFAMPQARNAGQADQRIAQAEDLIQRILGLAVVADLIAGNAGAIPRKQANARVEAALTAFRKLVLTEATKSAFEGGKGIEPRPQGVANGGGVGGHDSYVPPGADVGRNLLIRQPAGSDKPISITKIKGAAGLTRAITKVGSVKPILVKAASQANESIEPKYKFKSTLNLRATVRTMIVIESFFGLPKKRRAIRVVSRTGKDCTRVIKDHEKQHIQHHWEAWKATVVEKIRKNLSELGAGFKNLKDQRVRIVAATDAKKKNIGGGKIKVTYLDLSGEFVFPADKRSSAEKARNMISKAFKIDQRKQLTAAFEKHADALGEKYHKDVAVGLDDDCKPVRDPVKARTRFGTPRGK